MKNWPDLKATLNTVIFGSDTRGGRIFDVLLIACILISVVTVMLDSIAGINAAYGDILLQIEWFFTIVFSIEYGLRLICSRSPVHYARSFFGVIDLLAVLPTYLSLVLPGSQFFIVIRVLRVLRIFRVLKLVQYTREASILMTALRSSSRKIMVFLMDVLILVILLGSLMYMIEGEVNGFTSIPRSIYWAIVTMTTVGYGDISPQTPLGQFVAACIMIIGFGILAVPTGIVTVEMSRAASKSRVVCPNCGAGGHDNDALYCRYCGETLQ